MRGLGAQVVLTDRDDARITQLLSANIKGNRLEGNAVAMPLPWGTSSEEDVGPRPVPDEPGRLVLAADVIYSEEMVTPLLLTLDELCGPNAEVLLAYEEHLGAKPQERFWRLLKGSRRWCFRFVPMGEQDPTHRTERVRLVRLRKCGMDELPTR